MFPREKFMYFIPPRFTSTKKAIPDKLVPFFCVGRSLTNKQREGNIRSIIIQNDVHRIGFSLPNNNMYYGIKKHVIYTYNTIHTLYRFIHKSI